MGRLSEKNPRYRTLKTLVDDMAYVLNAPLALGTKYAVLRDACWVWTEFNGKYRGCPRWTKLALMLCVNAYKVGSRRKCEGLVHEHAVPKNLVVQFLSELNPATAETVRAVCEKFLFGVIVTKVEDEMLNVYYRDSMPPDFFDPARPEYHDPFLRYKNLQHKLSAIGEVQALEVLHLPDKWWLDIPMLRHEPGDSDAGAALLEYPAAR